MKKEIFNDIDTAKTRFDNLKQSADFVQLYSKGDEYVVTSDESYILIDEYIKPETVVKPPVDDPD